MPALIDHLKKEKVWDVRWRILIALRYLWENGWKDENLVPTIVGAMQDPNEKVRRRAIWVLEDMKEKEELIIPALAKALQDKNFEVRENAAWELGKRGEKSEQAIPNLIETLQDEEEKVRLNALRALAKIGEKAIKALFDAFHKGDKHLRLFIARITDSMYITKDKHSEKLIPYLLEALNDKDSEVRAQIAQAIGWLHKKGRKAIPALTIAMQD
jgi:HEAT repeat protein